MPDDVGGKAFQDDWEPDDDRGGAEEDFASVVFDEDFVRGARFLEPSAAERQLASAQAWAEAAEAEAARSAAAFSSGVGPEDEYFDGGHRPRGHGAAGPEAYEFGAGEGCGPYGIYGGALRPYRGQGRWHRSVAWVLAIIMGVGMVALAFTAVYRASEDRGDQAPPPATTGVDAGAEAGQGGTPARPTAFAEPFAPALPGAPAQP
ncbi:hypothetical protein [Streptomyces sp. NPDC006879]|uniref:SCO2584 family spore wall biosynthesis protein n=1 Tax=Streptomyces sp. NPDC006879 TaxID=3364767 RepID=UPI00369C065B